MNDRARAFVTPTNATPNSSVDAQLRPDAEMFVLVGGPYTLNGEVHRYGHTAIRIKTPEYDLTYDFGRYGRVTGDFGAEGEGILRVWSNFERYIATENALRTTTEFKYAVFEHQANAVKAFFDTKISAARNLPNKEAGRSYLKVYQLPENYHALGYNCTTISLDGANRAFSTYENGSTAFIRPEAVLTLAERLAMRTVGGGTPTRLFLPDNLLTFLTSAPAVPHISMRTYP